MYRSYLFPCAYGAIYSLIKLQQFMFVHVHGKSNLHPLFIFLVLNFFLS
jgi:hypothetical protein